MENYTFDLGRIFFGDAPPVFILEIAFRTTTLFMYTLINLRFLGNRGVSQLSTGEFALIIALGSAVGDPMFYPDVPLVNGMAVVTLIVIFGRLINMAAGRSRRAGQLLEGYSHRVVMDGELDIGGMRAAHLVSREIYSEVRQEGIESLGQVRRAYLEIDGNLSVFPYEPDDQRPGLSLIYEAKTDDIDLNDPKAQYRACFHCGFTQPLSEREGRCPRCRHKEWGRGILVQKAVSIQQGKNS